MSGQTIITISRQFGSGGKEIAEKLAKELNIPFYDRELIELAAKESGINEDLFEDEEFCSWERLALPSVHRLHLYPKCR